MRLKFCVCFILRENYLEIGSKLNKKTFKNILLVALLPLICSCHYSSEIVSKFEEAHKVDYQDRNNLKTKTVLAQYIPIGMNVKLALNLLKNEGFEITEHSLIGYRIYPNGNLNHYVDQDAVNRVKIDLGVADISYSARRTTGIVWFSSSNLYISMQSKNSKVLNVKAAIYVD